MLSSLHENLQQLGHRRIVDRCAGAKLERRLRAAWIIYGKIYF